MRADRRREADRRGVVADPIQGVVERVQLDGREEALEVVEHACLDVPALQDLTEDEQHQEGKREHREEEVVGDHARQPGDVLLVGALPERAQVATVRSRGAEASSGVTRPGVTSTPLAGRRTPASSAVRGPRTASRARLSSRTPSVAASAATATPAHARSSTPPCCVSVAGGVSGSGVDEGSGGWANGGIPGCSRSARLRPLAGSRLLSAPGAAHSRARAGEVAEHAALIVGGLVALVGLGLSLLAVGHSASIPSRSTDACAAAEFVTPGPRPCS